MVAGSFEGAADSARVQSALASFAAQVGTPAQPLITILPWHMSMCFHTEQSMHVTAFWLVALTVAHADVQGAACCLALCNR